MEKYLKISYIVAVLSLAVMLFSMLAIRVESSSMSGLYFKIVLFTPPIGSILSWYFYHLSTDPKKKEEGLGPQIVLTLFGNIISGTGWICL